MRLLRLGRKPASGCLAPSRIRADYGMADYHNDYLLSSINQFTRWRCKRSGQWQFSLMPFPDRAD